MTYPVKLCLAFPRNESWSPLCLGESSCLPKEADGVAQRSPNQSLQTPLESFIVSSTWSPWFGSNTPSPCFICCSWRQTRPEICLGTIPLPLSFYIRQWGSGQVSGCEVGTILPVYSAFFSPFSAPLSVIFPFLFILPPLNRDSQLNVGGLGWKGGQNISDISGGGK